MEQSHSEPDVFADGGYCESTVPPYRDYNKQSHSLRDIIDFDEEKDSNSMNRSKGKSHVCVRHIRAQSIPIYVHELSYLSRGKKCIRRQCHTLHRVATSSTTHMVNTASRVAKKVANYGRKLVSQWELPEWLRDNRYIYHFHRPQLDSFKKCFKSIFSIHSETGNIWSHLIGLLVIVSAAIYIFVRPHITINGFPHFPIHWDEILCYTAFFIGACVCMTFSWLFHTLLCHSKQVQDLFVKLDYSGISLLISGSLIPVLYYGFYCFMMLRIIYMCVTVVLACTCIGVSIWHKMSTPSFRPLRALIFILFGFSGIAPLVHIFMIYPKEYAIESVALYWVIAMGFLYVFGTFMYTFLIPERFMPGKINLIFQSHQIFHVCVVVAAILHLHACCLMSTFRVNKGNDCQYRNYTSSFPPFG